MMTRISQRIKFPWRFFVLVFSLSAPFWLIGAVIEQLLPEIPTNLPFSSLMAVSLPIAAVICTRREKGAVGVKELWKRSFDYKKIHRKIWYLPILFLMPAVALIQIGVIKGLYSSIPALQIPVLMIPVFLVVFFIEALAEEIGWQGYAIDRLQASWNVLSASLFLGIIWAVWHIIPFIQMQRTPAWIIWQCTNIAVTRVIMVWIYNNNRKSVFSSVLFHTMYNASTMLFPVYDPVIVTLILVAIAMVVTYLWGPKTLAEYRYPASGRAISQISVN